MEAPFALQRRVASGVRRVSGLDRRRVRIRVDGYTFTVPVGYRPWDVVPDGRNTTFASVGADGLRFGVPAAGDELAANAECQSLTAAQPGINDLNICVLQPGDSSRARELFDAVKGSRHQAEALNDVPAGEAVRVEDGVGAAEYVVQTPAGDVVTLTSASLDDGSLQAIVRSLRPAGG